MHEIIFLTFQCFFLIKEKFVVILILNSWSHFHIHLIWNVIHILTTICRICKVNFDKIHLGISYIQRKWPRYHAELPEIRILQNKPYCSRFQCENSGLNLSSINEYDKPKFRNQTSSLYRCLQTLGMFFFLVMFGLVDENI